MEQDQELIGLQNRLANNLEWQELKKFLIKEVEQELIALENEQAILEQDITDLLGVINSLRNKAINNGLILYYPGIANDMLQDVNVELDKNDKGETMQ